ncbi:MAG: glycine cleavage system protein GcvH [Ruaniaceae bacterium]|nr:glycine cleavage system protein GcvH [Ruaniaceae bacterium]
MSIPTDRHYTADHEWILIDGSHATIGITAHAAEALGDIVYVDLPESGTVVTAAESCGEIESTKSVSELFSPASGEVVESNESLDGAPETVNSDPYGEGWLWKMTVDSVGELLDAAGYAALIEAGE